MLLGNSHDLHLQAPNIDPISELETRTCLQRGWFLRHEHFAVQIGDIFRKERVLLGRNGKSKDRVRQ